MRYSHGEINGTYYITIFQGNSRVTLTFDTVQELNKARVAIENSTNFYEDKED